MKEESTDVELEPEESQTLKTSDNDSGTEEIKTVPKEKTSENIYDEKKDIQTNKSMAALAYLLFFLPLITEPAKTSKFARFHANQGLVYWIFYIAIIAVTRIICAIIWSAVKNGGPTAVWTVFNVIFWLLYVSYAALGIWCAYMAYHGKRKKIPLIGKITIIKEEASK